MSMKQMVQKTSWSEMGHAAVLAQTALEERFESHVDSSYDEWKSLAINEISHVSDDCDTSLPLN